MTNLEQEVFASLAFELREELKKFSDAYRKIFDLHLVVLYMRLFQDKLLKNSTKFMLIIKN